MVRVKLLNRAIKVLRLPKAFNSSKRAFHKVGAAAKKRPVSCCLLGLVGQIEQ